MTAYEFLLPDIGEGLHEAEIVTWFVAVGDYVKENENMVEVQTDKAVVEITAPVSGKIEALGGKEGEKITVGDVLVKFGETAVEKVASPIEKTREEQEETKLLPTKPSTTRIMAAPSVRKAARVAGVDLSKIVPTGKNGKILAVDLKNYIEQKQRNENIDVDIPLQKPQEIIGDIELESEKIKGVRKAIFENMKQSVSHAVHCTGMDKANVSGLVKVRSELLPYAEKLNIKLTYLPFIVKAVSIMLKKYPIFNSTVDEEEMLIIYNNEINIGIAMATEQGLIVPVIKNANQKSIIEIAKELSDLSNKARERKLISSDITGSTFTISSTGSKGGWFATPIINHPEVAILGIHKIEKEPIIVNDQIEIGHMMGMSLTFDHRVIDGEPSGNFMNGVAKLLEYPEKFLLELR